MTGTRKSEDEEVKTPGRVRKTCAAGHVFYKTPGCSTCPRCKIAARPAQGFLSTLFAPARRALENAGITSLAELAKHTEAEIQLLHGMGPSALPKLRKALAEDGKAFRSA